jgi:hypothetical protein
MIADEKHILGRATEKRREGARSEEEEAMSCTVSANLTILHMPRRAGSNNQMISPLAQEKDRNSRYVRVG